VQPQQLWVQDDLFFRDSPDLACTLGEHTWIWSGHHRCKRLGKGGAGIAMLGDFDLAASALNACRPS
jgi:hypothetical protein